MARKAQRRPSSFLPSDPRVVEPYRLTPKVALRLAVLGAVALGVFAVLFLRLWALQVLAGEQYLRTAQNNQVRTLRIEAPRGVVRDRNGRILVGNKVGTALQLWPADLPEKGRYQMLKRLAKIVRVPVTRIAREVDERKSDPLNPVIVKADLLPAEVTYIAERTRDLPGVMLVRTHLRDYPFGTLAAHVLGHVGEINPGQLERREYAGLRPGDKIGQAGVEAAFDRYLRGVPGQARVRVDALGRPRSDITPTHSAKEGTDVQLTIDADLQRVAERALENAIASAHAQQCFGCWNSNGGAIVALDARTGEVYAMASNPTFDPHVFVGKPNPWRLRPLLVDKAAERANIPGLNRAIAGAYAAGSTFKPVTAIAALEEHRVLPYQSIPCTPSTTYLGEDGVEYTWRNWDPFVNTAITMTTALAWSCDTYFYELGLRFYKLRTSPMQAWAGEFGFGKATGVELGPEATGLIPTPLWRRQTYETEIDKAWKPGDSIELTIGQGEMTVTPLQMARFYAMLANGGRLVTPHVFKEVEGPGRVPVVPRPTQPAPKRIDVSPAALQLVRDGLYQAAHDPNGTSTAVFGSFPVAIAGKTGTAEKSLSGYSLPFNHAWWCGYGPADDPRLVVCVLVEYGGHGGATAAPAAREVFAEYFGVDVGDIGPVASSETD